jgi:hypothetical protein
MRRGFSLVEALIALTIATAIVLLAGSLFVVQGNFYESLGRRARAQDNVRAVAERLATEIRSVMPGGIEEARSERLVFRRPLALGVLCDRSSGRAHVQLGMSDEIVGELVEGFAWRGTATGWEYRRRPWSALFDSRGGAAAQECFEEGADTLGASDTFIALRGVSGPAPGDLLMVYAEIAYEVDASALDATSLGLFRTVSGGDEVEFASGLGADTEFSYRVGSVWQSGVTGSALAAIEAVRVTIESRIRAETGGVADAVVAWSVEIPLANAS